MLVGTAMIGLLTRPATALGRAPSMPATTITGTGAVTLDSDLARYLPHNVALTLPPPPLTDEQIDAMIAQMKARIFLYTQPRSRYDQLLVEFHSIENNPDRGRILHRLYLALPPNGLAEYVRTEIQKVREEVAAGK